MKQDNNTTQQEELDLGKLFQLIGNGIKNIFNGIGRLLKNIFHYFILLILFFKKHALYLGIAAVIGAISGYIYERVEDDYTISFTSEMDVMANYGSAKRLYSQLEYLNNLISKEDSVKIASIFDLSFKEAKDLKGFSVEPIDSDKQMLQNYDRYMQLTDTIYTRGFEFNDFINRKTETDLKNHLITAIASNPNIFLKLKKGFKFLIENEYYKLLHSKTNNLLDFKKEELLNNLKQLDSIRKRYDKVAILQAKNGANSNSNINFTSRNNKERNLDMDLYYMSNTLIEKIEKIDYEKISHKEILKIVSDFEYGEEINSIKNKLWFRYSIYGFALSLLIIIGLKFNKYLTNYKQKIA